MENKNYFIENYIHRSTPEHHDDSAWNDQSQYEVYRFCKTFMDSNGLRKVVDVGCGSGYKLINYLGDFETVGIETDPCFSQLIQMYPDRNWLISGEPEKSFNPETHINDIDVVLCCDVIEHIVDPDDLLEYLIKLDAKYYIISTPCREVLCKGERFSSVYGQHWHGPPLNPCHVREWTMSELSKYLSTRFEIISSHYGESQIECQWHLLKLKKEDCVNPKVLVISANIGSSDSKSIVEQSGADVTFIHFNDLHYPFRKKVLHPRLIGKIPKMLAWELYPGYDFYIWLDNQFTMTRSSAVKWFISQLGDSDAAFFAHSARSSIESEARCVIQLVQNGDPYFTDRYELEDMENQVKTYLADPLFKDNYLIEAGAFIYRQNLVKNANHNVMKDWFHHNCRWSVQDQLSLPYLLQKFKVKFNLISRIIYSEPYNTDEP
jgi:SAM-dependent methyltransferase